jgi:hypothetical protein
VKAKFRPVVGTVVVSVFQTTVNNKHKFTVIPLAEQRFRKRHGFDRICTFNLV